MVFVYRAAIISLVTFTSALVGFGLQSLLPDTYIAASKGMIGSMVGPDATLLALVLGLLIWTGHGQFTAQQAQLQTIGRSIVLLDLAFAGYGPDAAAGRREIREILNRARARFWIEDPKGRRTIGFAGLPAEVLPMRAVFASLHPTSDEQRQHLVAARDLFGTIVDTGSQHAQHSPRRGRRRVHARPRRGEGADRRPRILARDRRGLEAPTAPIASS
jgi:hypothetical protein